VISRGEEITLNELNVEIQKRINEGYGDKIIMTDEERNIDSIQSNTMPNTEPDYFIVMSK